MGVSGTLFGEFTAVFTGLDTDWLTPPEWAKLVGSSARRLQKRIARSFAAQKVAGSTWLLPNDPKYTARKVAQGLDRRRGHRTGILQGVLDSLVRLYQVTITSQGNKSLAARVVFEEGMLHSLVPYAVYYEEAKVTRGGILALAASWVREEAMTLQRALSAAQLKRRRIDRSGQNKLRANMNNQRAAALNIINRTVNTSGQDVLRANVAALRRNAAKLLSRRGF